FFPFSPPAENACGRDGVPCSLCQCGVGPLVTGGLRRGHWQNKKGRAVGPASKFLRMQNVSRDGQVRSRCLAALRDEFVIDRLAFVERAEARAFNRADMHEYVTTAV